MNSQSNITFCQRCFHLNKRLVFTNKIHKSFLLYFTTLRMFMTLETPIMTFPAMCMFLFSICTIEESSAVFAHYYLTRCGFFIHFLQITILYLIFKIHPHYPNSQIISLFLKSFTPHLSIISIDGFDILLKNWVDIFLLKWKRKDRVAHMKVCLLYIQHQ